MDIKPFKELIPTTITLLGSFSKPINLEIAFDYLPVLENPTVNELLNNVPRNKKVNFPFVLEEGIISLRLKDKVRTETEGHQYTSKCSWRSRGFIGNAPFSNSLALDASIKNGRMNKNISAKIFPGGRFLLNGFLREDVAEDYAFYLLDLLKDCGACDEDATLDWLSAQTINYKYHIGFNINLMNLGELLYQTNLIKNYDNLTLDSKIEITVESKVDKSHLKSKKPSVQRIKIHESGKILQHGPCSEELEKSYNRINELLLTFRDRIEIKTKEPCLSTLETRILEVLEKESLTSTEIQKLIGDFKKVDINAGINQLIASDQIEIVGKDLYKKI